MIGKTTRVLREKLQDCHGDTMVEVLAAVFIAALGATMLASMVTVSATASARSQQVLNASYAAEASLYDSSSYGPVVSVTLPDSSTAVPIKVSVYQSGGYAYYEEGRSQIVPARDGLAPKLAELSYNADNETWSFRITIASGEDVAAETAMTVKRIGS